MKFKTRKVLSAATGTLLTSMDDVYEVLSFMTGEELFTHQLPRAFKQCEADFARQLPMLKHGEFRDRLASLKGCRDMAKFEQFLQWVDANFGDEVELQPLVIQQPQNPITELCDMLS